MVVEKGTFNHVEELSKLFDDYRAFYGKPSDREGAKTFLWERLKNNESVIFVATTLDGVMTGFVQLYPLFSSTRMKRLWLLNDLFVSSAFRGKGVSVMLIDRAKEFSQETPSCGLVLETAKANVVANALYTRTGFSLDEEYNHYAWNE